MREKAPVNISLSVIILTTISLWVAIVAACYFLAGCGDVNYENDTYYEDSGNNSHNSEDNDSTINEDNDSADNQESNNNDNSVRN